MLRREPGLELIMVDKLSGKNIWIKAPPSDQANHLDRVLQKKYPRVESGYWQRNNLKEPVENTCWNWTAQTFSKYVFPAVTLKCLMRNRCDEPRLRDLRKIKHATADIPDLSLLKSILKVINPVRKNRPVDTARSPSDNCSMVAG